MKIIKQHFNLVHRLHLKLFFFSLQEVDEVGAAIREAGMFTVGTQQEFEYQTWNWDLISTILEVMINIFLLCYF